MKKPVVWIALLGFFAAGISFSQTSRSAFQSHSASSSTLATVPDGDFVHTTMRHFPWERTVFLDGGLGTSGETGDRFLNAGVRVGKILTEPALPGLLRGQFEYAVEIIPYWQAFTPKQTYFLTTVSPPRTVTTGGTYTGVSITPIILRWNLVRPRGRWRRAMPWLQGAGGLVWTNHKFPPNGPRGTSVWNFEPQFGLGMHYFLKPGRSLDFAANAVHISNASLGDSNPGVNATVRFQIGYTWWR